MLDQRRRHQPNTGPICPISWEQTNTKSKHKINQYVLFTAAVEIKVQEFHLDPLVRETLELVEAEDVVRVHAGIRGGQEDPGGQAPAPDYLTANGGRGGGRTYGVDGCKHTGGKQIKYTSNLQALKLF